MDRRPPNLWFIAAYVLLVAIAALGFYWQSQTIDTLESHQHQIDQITDFERVRAYNAGIVTCQLLLDIVEPEQRETVIAAFATQRVNCEADLKKYPPLPPAG